MKYTINTYDPATDVANVTFNYNFKGNPQVLTGNFSGVPVEDDVLCDEWALNYIEAYKAGLKSAAKVLINSLKSQRTVVDPVE